MRRGLKAIAAVAGGVIAGFSSAHWAMERVAGEGPWRREQAPGDAGNPYVIARQMLKGQLPSPAPGTMDFVLERDGDGALLDPDCDYLLSGRMPPALWWSLSAGGGEGQGLSMAVTPGSAVFEADGSLRVAISGEPKPGNVIRPPQGGVFAIRLRLLARAQESGAARTPVLAFARGECR
jgi:hypothetical protein